MPFTLCVCESLRGLCVRDTPGGGGSWLEGSRVTALTGLKREFKCVCGGVKLSLCVIYLLPAPRGLSLHPFHSGVGE